MFAGLPEAIAASYNGGEDNVARWLGRSNQTTKACSPPKSGSLNPKLRVQSDVLLPGLPATVRFKLKRR